MASKRTPPILTRGRYVLQQPWVANPGKLYTCQAIRSFKDLYEKNIDPYTQYYEPKGLGEGVFSDDVSANANIVTLISDNNDIIYVPDTYIASYPDMGDYEYSQMILSCSLGALPDYLDLTYLKSQVSQVASDVIGAEPEVLEHRGPSTGAVSASEHETLEAARLSAISQRETTYAQLQRAQTTIANQQQQIETLEQILIDNGLLD